MAASLVVSGVTQPILPQIGPPVISKLEQQ